ncbi:MAG: Replication initiator protein [Verrucomicrobiales bacterium]|nr:Replication initiator protein [Verrucomicrobiales bacterium]
MAKPFQAQEPDLDLGDGRDELNLAEFPLSLLSKRPDQDAKVLVFEDQIWDSQSRSMVTRKVTISGSADCGLPNASDEEVLLALIQITKLQSFRNKKVHFSRYQLLQILGWEDNGYYYNRIVSALNTWLGVNVKWHNAWRDYSKKTSWGDKGIVLIQAFELKKRERSDSASYITWADHLFESFQAGNLKGLDFGLYRALRDSIAKRMFRFLDKRFYNREMLSFDLATFAYEKIGMKRTYGLNNVKQKFKSAIEELVAVGFLKPMDEKQRYRKRRAGEWDVCFTKVEQDDGQRLLALEIDTLPQIENELVRRGVSRARAKSLAVKYPEMHIREKLEEFDYLMSRAEGDPLRPQNPGGYLAQAIEDNYTPPRGFQSQDGLKRAQQEKEAQALQRKEAREAKRKAEAVRKAVAEQEFQQKAAQVREYLTGLTERERKAVEKSALAASPFGSSPSPMVRESLIHNHVLELLENKG